MVAAMTLAAYSEAPTLLTLYNLLHHPHPDHLIRLMVECPSELVRNEGRRLRDKMEPKTRAILFTSVLSAMAWFQGDDLRRFTSARLEPVDFAELRRWPVAVFYCVHAADMEILRPLTSMFFTLAVDQLSRDENPEPIPVRLFLDEFAQIGRIRGLTQFLATARSMDIGTTIVIQSFKQVRTLYDEEADIILQLCQTKYVLAGLDVQECKYISEALGKETIIQEKVSVGTSGHVFDAKPSRTRSTVEHARALLESDEVRRLPAKKALIISTNRKPMLVNKFIYAAPPNPAPSKALGAARGMNYEHLADPHEQPKDEKPAREPKPKRLPPPLPPMGDLDDGEVN
jgi:type IV secretory pathway TraG/TraD family ATPase VirD4